MTNSNHKDSRFRSNGHLLTIPLFYERASLLKKPLDRVLFSMDGRTETHPDTGYKLINARMTFIAMKDPTGVKWARQYLESFEHFKRLEKASWFAEELEEWREEMATIQQAEALEVVQKLVADEDAPEGTRLAAAKYLAERGWEKKTRGRPSKKEIAGNLKEEVRKQSTVMNDAERIGLKVVK